MTLTRHRKIAVGVGVAALTLFGVVASLSGGDDTANAAAQPAGSPPAATTPAAASVSPSASPTAAPAVAAQPNAPRANGEPVPTPSPSTATAGSSPTSGTSTTTQPPATPSTTTPPPAPTTTQPPAPVEWPQSTGGKPGGCWRDPCEHVYGLYATESYDSFPGCVGTGFWFHLNGVNVEACASLMGGTWTGTATAACHVVIHPNDASKPARVYDFPAGASVSFYFNVYDHDVSIGYGCGVFTNG